MVERSRRSYPKVRFLGLTGVTPRNLHLWQDPTEDSSSWQSGSLLGWRTAHRVGSVSLSFARPSLPSSHDRAPGRRGLEPALPNNRVRGHPAFCLGRNREALPRCCRAAFPSSRIRLRSRQGPGPQPPSQGSRRRDRLEERATRRKRAAESRRQWGERAENARRVYTL